jgi:methylated-DNA-[protein]-cysteine S-methyltransferase
MTRVESERRNVSTIGSTMKLLLSELDSPLGTMLLVTDEREQVRALHFGNRMERLHRSLREHYGACELTGASAPAAVAHAVGRYFDGDVQALDSINVAIAGTDLQRDVWAALRRIRVGQTTTYGALSRSLGFSDPRAAIDVGAAIGANPIAVVVPCHRVVASNGDLKGYAWGLHRKRWLLEHEGAIQPQVAALHTASLPGF